MDLLPVKTGMETFPVKYFNFLEPDVSPYNVILAEWNRTLYIMVMRGGSTPYWVYLYKMNLFTSAVSEIGKFSLQSSTMGNIYIGGFLVDDGYIYFSRGEGQAIMIYVYRLSTLEFVYARQYAAAVQDYGSLTWKDEHTIVLPLSNGVLFFDTITREFTAKTQSTNYNYLYSPAIGKHSIILARANNNTPALIVYHMDDDTWSTIALTSYSSATAVCYSNGKFYAANTQYLYIIDEVTEQVETIAVPWQNVRTIHVTNDTVFISSTGSQKVYIYDLHAREFRYVIAPWTAGSWTYSSIITPFSLSGYYFIAKNTLMVIDYSGYSKYNFGSPYDSFVVQYAADNMEEFVYDPRFVTFRDTFMTINDGDIRYDFETIDPENHIRSATISKSDYKKLHLVSIT